MTHPAAELTTLPEIELVRLAKLGRRDAFASLMQRCNQRLFRVARAVVSDDAEAEDVVQEAYLNAFAAFGGFRGEAQFSTWLTRIVLNEARGRVQRRRPTLDLAEVEAAQSDASRVLPFPGAQLDADPERAAARAEARRLLEREIDALPEPFRLVYILREIDGCSVEETAEQLELRPETVKTRLHRARRLLRSSLDATLAEAVTGAFPFLGARCERMTAAVLAEIFRT